MEAGLGLLRDAESHSSVPARKFCRGVDSVRLPISRMLVARTQRYRGAYRRWKELAPFARSLSVF